MEYSVFFLINGEANEYRENLMKEIDLKFKGKCIINMNLHSHITLKTPFEFKEIKKLKNVLKDLSKETKVSIAKIEGFRELDDLLIALNIRFSNKTNKLQKKLIDKLDNIQVTIEQHDRKFIPHSTIIYGSDTTTHKQVFKFLKNFKEPPFFRLYLNEIVLMIKRKGKWKIHTVFPLRKF